MKVFFLKLLFVALASAIGFLALKADAQTNCTTRDEVVSRLKDEWKEGRRGIGLLENGLIELYVSADGQTWTLLMTRPDGVSCLIAAGAFWSFYPPPQRGGM